MQIANQQVPALYYYPAYQTNNLITAHLSQAHSNVHVYQRIEPNGPQMLNQMHRLNPQLDNLRPRHFYSEKEPEHSFPKSDLHKMHSYATTESPAPRNAPCDPPNIQNCLVNNNRSNATILSDSAVRNRSVFQIKRKESSNGNARDAREEYYKGQQHREELLNKLPQIQLQQVNRPYIPRLTQLSPSKSPNIRQMKKNSSPSPFKFRSASFKEHNFVEGLHMKKAESTDCDEPKKPKQITGFRSGQSTNRQCQQKNSNFKYGLNTDRNQISVCSTSHGHSNSASLVFDEFPKFQPLKVGINSKNSFQIFDKKELGKQVECQANLGQIEDSSQQVKLKNHIKCLQTELGELKNVCCQKDFKLRQLEHEMNLQKIGSQKKLLVVERELTAKKQAQISSLKQQYEKTVSKTMSDLIQKLTSQHEEAELKLQSQLNQLKSQSQELRFQLQSITNQKNQLSSNVLNQQKIIVANQRKIRDLERIKGVYQQKNIKLQQLNENLNNKVQSWRVIANPSQCQGCMNRAHRHDEVTNTETKANEHELKQKIKQLQEKLSLYLSNMDKQSQQLKQSRNQVEKYRRRSQDFNFSLIDKEALVKSLYKDLKSIEKELLDSKKFNEQLSEMLNMENCGVVRMQARMLSEKYRQVQE